MLNAKYARWVDGVRSEVTIARAEVQQSSSHQVTNRLNGDR